MQNHFYFGTSSNLSNLENIDGSATISEQKIIKGTEFRISGPKIQAVMVEANTDLKPEDTENKVSLSHKKKPEKENRVELSEDSKDNSVENE